ncbi:MAG: YfhO family protein, partial [bacterium]
SASSASTTAKTRALKEATVGLGVSLLLVTLLAAPQLWPTLRYLPYTSRQGFSQAALLTGSIRPYEALAWIVPGFFGWGAATYHGSMRYLFSSDYLGLLPLCLAAGGLSALWKRDTRVRWLALLSLTAFFFAQSRWTPFYAVFRHLPVVPGFRIWYRILFLNTFAICILAALGFDALISTSTRRKALRGALIFLALAAVFAAGAWLLAPSQARAGLNQVQKAGCSLAPPTAIALLTDLSRGSALRSLELLALLTALLGLFRRRPLVVPALALALAFHAYDQSRIFERFVTFMNPADAVAKPDAQLPPPPTSDADPWRVYALDTSHPNEATRLGYENLAGYESMPLKNFQDLTDAFKSSPGAYYNLMGERYWFLPIQKRSMDRTPSGDLSIRENREAYPRAWLVGKSRAVSDKAETYALLARHAFDPRSEVAVSADLRLAGSAPRGSVHWLKRSPLAFSLAVD